MPINLQKRWFGDTTQICNHSELSGYPRFLYSSHSSAGHDLQYTPSLKSAKDVSPRSAPSPALISPPAAIVRA